MVDRTDAVLRISEALGFRSGLDDVILRRLQEAQRDLEKGKTLPRFLLQEDQTLVLLAGQHEALIPAGFIRMEDSERFHFTPQGRQTPVFLTRKLYEDALVAQLREGSTIERAPSVYVIRQYEFDFIVTANMDYEFTYSYYKAEPTLDTNMGNAWLYNAPEWLIGEAGYRLAKDLRDAEAVQIFDGMRTQGRAATFGELLASAEADGPTTIGADL